MALIDDIILLVDQSDLVNLVKVDGVNTVVPITTTNNARLIRAVALTKAAFKRRSGTTFDDTDDMHIEIGIEGVRIKLRQFKKTGAQEANRAWNTWLENVEDIESRTTKAQPAMRSDQAYNPSEVRSDQKPPFDSDHLRGMRVRPPRGLGDRGDDFYGAAP